MRRHPGCRIAGLGERPTPAGCSGVGIDLRLITSALIVLIRPLAYCLVAGFNQRKVHGGSSDAYRDSQISPVQFGVCNFICDHLDDVAQCGHSNEGNGTVVALPATLV
jgi:hypothetical protein